MKFLLSGSLFQKRGPRSLLLKTLFLIFAGVVLHAAHFMMDCQDRWQSLSPSEIVGDIEMSQTDSEWLLEHQDDQSPEAAAGLYENLHIDLFLFSILYLFLASVWLQAPPRFRLRAFYLHAPAIILFLLTLMRLFSHRFSQGLYAEIVLALLFYLIYFSNIFVLGLVLRKPALLDDSK